jgi:D-glycero-D-manno-heptose 1,7-bisphosphate phosphatase
MSQVYWFEKDAARRDCPCLFLDRDGVVVEEVHYLHRPGDVRLLAGAVALIAAARASGWAVGLVTNQAGVGRGYYDWSAFGAVQDALVAQLGLGPEPFDFVAACGSHPDAADPFHRVADHSWRKPNPGMLRMAAGALRLDLAASTLIGDQVSDMRAGAAAGVARLIHVATGHGAAQREAASAIPGVVCLRDLTETLEYLGFQR